MRIGTPFAALAFVALLLPVTASAAALNKNTTRMTEVSIDASADPCLMTILGVNFGPEPEVTLEGVSSVVVVGSTDTEIQAELACHGVLPGDHLLTVVSGPSQNDRHASLLTIKAPLAGAATDAAKLGGLPPEGYWRKTDLYDGDVQGPGDDLQLKPGVVGNDELANGAVTESKLGFDTATQVELDTEEGARQSGDNHSGDVSGPNTNLQIEPGAVDTSELANGAVTENKLGFDTATQAELDAEEGARQSGDSHSGDVSGPNTNLQIGPGTVGSSEIANGSVGGAEVNSGQVQLRVGGSCPPGSSIRIVNQNGSVVCETDTDTDTDTVTEWFTTDDQVFCPSNSHCFYWRSCPVGWEIVSGSCGSDFWYDGALVDNYAVVYSGRARFQNGDCGTASCANTCSSVAECNRAWMCIADNDSTYTVAQRRSIVCRRNVSSVTANATTTLTATSGQGVLSGNGTATDPGSALAIVAKPGGPAVPPVRVD